MNKNKIKNSNYDINRIKSFQMCIMIISVILIALTVYINSLLYQILLSFVIVIITMVVIEVSAKKGIKKINSTMKICDNTLMIVFESAKEKTKEFEEDLKAIKLDVITMTIVINIITIYLYFK